MRKIAIPAVLIFLCILVWHFWPSSDPAPDKDIFTVEAQEDTYPFTLKAGFTYKLALEQCGMDIEPIAIAPDGTEYPLDRRIGAKGQEFIWILPDQDETWVLKVIATGESKGDIGYYRVWVDEVHQRCSNDYELLHIQSIWFKTRANQEQSLNFEDAHATYNEIVSYYFDVGEDELAADYMVEFSWICLRQGKYQLGLGLGYDAIEIYKKFKNDHGLSNILYITGYINYILSITTGDPLYATKALQEYFALWRIIRDTKFWQKEINAINNICGILEETGLYEEALSATKQAVESTPNATGNKFRTGLLCNLATMYFNIFKDIDKAQIYALEAEESLRMTDPKLLEAKTISPIATIYSAAGYHDKAADLFAKAVDLCEKQEPTYTNEIRYHQASNLFKMQKSEEAYTILDGITKDQTQMDMGQIYFIMARIKSESDPDAARALFLKAFKSYSKRNLEAPASMHALAKMTTDPTEKELLLEEAMRSAERLRSLYSNQNLRTGVFDRYFKIYASAIENYMDQSRKPNDVFVAKAFNILEQASGKSLRESTLLGINKSRAEIDINALYRNDPAAWRALEHHLTHKVESVGDGASTLEEIQRGMGPDTLLLMTLLRPEHSYIWYVWENGYRAISSKSSTEFERLVLAFRQQIEQGSADLLKSDVGHELYNALFPPDLPLNKFKRLAVVVDDALTLLPFAALPSRDQHYLVENLDIVYLPTASHAAKQPSYAKARATKAIGLFANPIFKPTDSRLRQVLSSEEIAEAVQRSPSDRLELSRLEGTEAEAKAILNLPSLANQPTRAYRGFEATRSAALDPSLRDYRILHFATHCQIDNLDSSQSKLILSCYDANGKEIPGELTMADITELKLLADLVVLSACETALGRRVRGAGPMSLSRGFMLAGVPRVAATLWSIDDKASPNLMKHFYTAMLEQGKSPGAALSQAQRQMLAEPVWHHPKYWSAFILLGDWR